MRNDKMIKVCTAVLLFCAVLAFGQKPLARFSATGNGNSVTFADGSSGNPTSYSWVFPNGSPATSTSANPVVSYSGSGPYQAKLTVTNSDGTSSVTKTISNSATSVVDLSTGRNNDGSLLSTAAQKDLDWSVTNASNVTTIPVTRPTYSGWSYALLGSSPQNSVWITHGAETGYFDYKSKTFTIPEGVTNAKLNLRSLSYIRNWTSLVKINSDNTTTATQITATSWLSDGAKGWINSRSPEVINYAIAPGTYYINVQVYTNNGTVKGSLDVNANVQYGGGQKAAGDLSFSSAASEFCRGTSNTFTASVSGSASSYNWVFKKGNDSLTATGQSPNVTFPEAGSYSASLKVVFADGSISTLSVPDYLTVTNCKDYTLAPNSYIFDIKTANDENREGLMIPVAKAYEMWRKNEYFKNADNTNTPIPAGTQSTDVYWEDVPGLIRKVDLLTGATADSTKLKVYVDRTRGKGNAVISFKVNGNIYWSWHIWVTDDPTEGVVYSQGFETDLNNNPFSPQYMDRNMGATNASFLGNDWNKSGGLMYQWGRKDPIPPLMYKDGSVYEVAGSAGNLRHAGAINTLNSSKIKMISRGAGTGNFTGSNFINDNIKYAVLHPVDYITHTEAAATWFSNQQYKLPDPDVTKIVSWNLWSDNRQGKFSSQASSDPVISADSRSYEVKSSFDPCPNGWRIPSNYMSAGVNNNQSPFGRKNSGANDDNTASGKFYPDSENANLQGIKVYPALGIDFSDSTADRNLGLMPLAGNYEYYPASGQAIYQDPGADGVLMTATYGTVSNGQAAGYRGLLITSDPGQPDTVTGRNAIYVNETFPTAGSGAVRCMKDPNYAIANYDFVTEYFSGSQSLDVETYKTWSEDPNSYLVFTNTLIAADRVVEINLRKAYAMQRLYLNENNETPSGSVKSASVQWTSNTSLIKSYEIVEGGESGSVLRLTLNPNQTGNAVVAFHLGNNGIWGTSNPDKILWSWHLWAPKSAINETTYATESTSNGGIVAVSNPNFVNPTKSGTPPLSTTFMDRNLGAVTSFPNADGFGGTAIASDPNILNSAGLHYQWGRKDPVPTFFTPGGVAATPIYRQVSYTNGVIGYGTAVNDASFTSNSTVEYNTYASGVFANDSKAERNRKIIKYSVENTSKFMYHNRSGSEIKFLGAGTFQSKTLQVKDWISPAGNVGSAPDRWGHATSKSPYDPCPAGWRVPDTSFASMVNGVDKGTSPWFLNNYKKGGALTNYGFSQAFPFNLKGAKANNNSETERLYPGKLVKKFTAPATVVGWEFDFSGSVFNIGNFPNTGIRGVLGGNDWVDRYDLSTLNYKKVTGVWTASLGDFFTGYAIAMQIDEYSTNGELLTGVGHYPQAAMGVRCAKDLPRYIIDDVAPRKEQKVILPVNEIKAKSEILLFPNPTSNEVFVNKKVKSFTLYDITGKMLKQQDSGQSINLSHLPNGEYIVVLQMDEGAVVSKKIIKK